jgi:uncharacterized membrane protein
MSARGFYPLEAVRFSWNTLKGNFIFFLLIAAAVSSVIYFPEAARALLAQITARGILLPLGLKGMQFLAIGAAVVIASAVEIALLRIALSFYDHMGLESSDLLRALAAMPSYLISSALFLLMVSLGLAFFVLPGIYLFLKYQFYGYFIADRRQGPFSALKQSARITDGLKRRLMAFWFISYTIVLAITSLLAILIFLSAGYAIKFVPEAFVPLFYRGLYQAMLISALFILIPMTKLGTAYIYRTLERQDRAEFIRSGCGRKSISSERRFGKI